MSTSTISQLTAQALDPARSVVVEACAGSGKTWLLASRIVRLLLAGVPPGAILAITFTRKAAREIEERVVDWLRLLATGGEAEVAAFLVERGVNPDEATLRTARALYENVLAAQPALAVNTFHGWFLQLVDAAPLSANLAGATLAEFDSRLFDELWQTFAAELARHPDSEATRAFVALLDAAGLEAVRRLMRRAHDRRCEWLALGAATGEDGPALAGRVVDALRERLGAGEPGGALAGFFGTGWADDVQAYLGLLEMSELATDQRHAAALREALAAPAGEACFALLRGVLLTASDALRKREANKAAEKRFTPAGAARLAALHAALGERVLECLERQTAERILAFNRRACAVFAAFLAHVEAFKRARRQIDFTDAEWQVLRLLREPDTAAFLQARLDARYKHVLLDEFQDTNPLQWQILRAWFDAYSDADRPRVFLVGDPKQSIYRFRRAEPRLFAVAADFLQRGFAAVRCEQDATRRNAPPIIDVVNALFLGVPEFAPFRAQSSLAGNLPGRVELLPLCARVAGETAPGRDGLRDPLAEPDVEPEDLRRQEEAAALAAKIAEIVGRGGPAWLIEAKGADGGVRRPARYGDFILLARSRTHLACYERALAEAGIPFDAGARGGLLDTLEVRDIVALLEFLVTPVDDLKLAQALRSPLFACGDEDLAAVAAAVAADGRAARAPWWPRLVALAEAGAAGPRLARAAHLLGDWLRVAGKLPVHDLLDRIYHQGEVPARYRLAVPPAAAPAVEANLRALLLLSLDLEGGRYPSLPRFIDALRDLREADANDAPDEGRIEAEPDERNGAGPDDAGRVRILTIHGAKGLEAPIVWLLGANESPRGGEAWDVLVDWPPDEDAPRHFSFFGRKEERGAARQALFDAEAAAARREELNLLYVAVTRARQVFIASGIESARSAAGTPYRLLEKALGALGGAPAYGDALPTAALPDAPPPSGKTVRAAEALPAVGERKPEAQGGERFGILLHALLERRTQGGDAGCWWKALGFDDAEYRRALPVAERLLAAAPLRRFFAPELHLRAWNEVEFTDGAGALLRLDRLVEFADGLWVLDYKSSGSDTQRLADYRAQVAGYCRVVAAAYPGRAVRGALLFADAALVEVEWAALNP
ncbi:UvrD-helicase domain-containing protein [Propionivibrio sp.]|uniref:UvrD-helicase domain-containing protein n=1 Tax=Propionivibrio sp. TaxID=2212460 RepID=UPI0039E5365E